jgi:biopolymer transport protein ExbD
MRSKRRHRHEEAELNITSFMNLMIILVPVLLLSMVFSHITVLDLQLPDLSDSDSEMMENLENQQLELVIRADHFQINFPAGVSLRRIEKTAAGEHDYAQLSAVLQEVKRTLAARNIDKGDIVILSEKDTDYQTIVSVMDTARSFKAVVAASVVDAALFPQISLGDAPQGGRP